MVIIGATASKSAIKIPTSEIIMVANKLQLGSPFALPLANGFKIGMTLSLAMACRSLGAPVSDWRPAPIEDMHEPMIMIHGVGHVTWAMTRPWLSEEPNLSRRSTLSTHAPRRRMVDR